MALGRHREFARRPLRARRGHSTTDKLSIICLSVATDSIFMPFLISPGLRLSEFLITNGRTSALRHVTRETSAYASSGRRRSAAAKLGWIIVGRRVVVVGPQTTRNGVVAIDPHATRSGVAGDHSLAGTNDDISRFGMMPSCGGVRRSPERDQKT